jgi:hypothetical protein
MNETHEIMANSGSPTLRRPATKIDASHGSVLIRVSAMSSWRLCRSALLLGIQAATIFAQVIVVNMRPLPSRASNVKRGRRAVKRGNGTDMFRIAGHMLGQRRLLRPVLHYSSGLRFVTHNCVPYGAMTNHRCGRKAATEGKAARRSIEASLRLDLIIRTSGELLWQRTPKASYTSQMSTGPRSARSTSYAVRAFQRGRRVGG